MEALRRTNCHFVHCLLPKRDAGLCDMKTAALTNGESSPSPASSPAAGVPSVENCVDVPLLREQLRGFKVRIETLVLHGWQEIGKTIEALTISAQGDSVLFVKYEKNTVKIFGREIFYN